MIDHVGLSVTNYETAKAFYVKALAPLGYELIMEFGEIAGFGQGGKPDFWISKGTPAEHLHVAIAADNRAAVDKFYEAAMAAGGKDNGAPGLREVYHPNYYGAFVLGPDGLNIEAVCHQPE
jgi:catechol 2,3-dioxygenase-like lactoylglutathione lyase family enzyme